MKITFLILFLFAITQLEAKPTFPELSVPNTFGVCIVGPPLEEIDFGLLQKTGFKWIRKGVDWKQIEPKKGGPYDFTYSDALIKKCEEHDMGLVMNLAFGHKEYEPKSPRMYIASPEGREGFANYCAAIAERYKGKNIIYVFWNEASGSFWKSPNYKKIPVAAGEYMAVQNLAANKMKAIDPDCILAGGSLFEINWDRTAQWLDTCLKLGANKNTDAIDFHGYCGRPQNDMPELIIPAYRDMQKQLVKHGISKDFPFLQSEYGINIQFDHWKGTHQQGEMKQAACVVRMYLVTLLLEMPINIHYEYKSRSESSRGDKGLLNKDGSEAPVMQACRTIMSLLKGYTFKEQIQGFGKDDYIIKFTHPSGETKLVCWTSPRDSTSNVQISVGTNTTLNTWDLLGKSGSITPQDEKVSITLSNQPVYIQLP